MVLHPSLCNLSSIPFSAFSRIFSDFLKPSLSLSNLYGTVSTFKAFAVLLAVAIFSAAPPLRLEHVAIAAPTPEVGICGIHVWVIL
ncbi:hypothetical protein K1719_036580 [Acacia pycnantha]|nr:hypothetical protein K1719_036580 [Acacia pycnantha]